MSETIKRTIGLGQEVNAGISFEIYIIALTCLIFLDDFAIPTTSEEDTVAALKALDTYSDK